LAFETHLPAQFGRRDAVSADRDAVRGAEGAPKISTLLDSYVKVRRATEALCAPLAAEDFVVQSMPDASPAKWHLAHTSWFFEEFVLQSFAAPYRFHEQSYRYLFNSYYEAAGPRHPRPERGLISRPTVEQTFAYRAHVDEQMSRLLAQRDESDELWRVVTLGLHHEQQHQELLLTDLKHAFSRNPLAPAYTRPGRTAPHEAPALGFIDVEGGLVDIGHDGRGFSFDNELPRHRVYLAPFRIANRLITNEEFRGFIASGGYTSPEHWLSDGWAVVQRERWERPLYWTESLEREFTLGGMQDLDADAPVCHLSYYEADAFARWAGARLPTEFEWELAASALPIRGNFVEDEQWHPRRAAAAADTQPQQMFGDAWEWTRSAYAPYPGYTPPEGALGEYNGKFMVSQLVLRGGSCVTPRSHIRATYRNFFPPGARWQMSGLRLAMDV
jgi:ergothioneine biosynthesis protein EgtB